MPGRPASLQKKWLQLFFTMWRGVLASPRLRQTPPSLELKFSDQLSASQIAAIGRGKNGNGTVIEISAKFSLAFEAELRGLADTLTALLFRSASARQSGRRQALEAVEELAIGFILLHEIFHLVSGHFGWLEARLAGLSFDEGQLGMAPHLARKRPAIADAYLLESEADCSAIQWIVQETSLKRLSRLLGTGPGALQLFPKRQRIQGFRLLLAAVWLVIRKLESTREKWLHNDSKTHPLPTTRVFMAFGTLIQQYCRISDLRFDAQGGGQHTLTDGDVASMREFLTEILRPVLASDWNPGSANVPAQSLEGRMRLYLPDFANHLLNRPVETAAGRELLRMERARFRMDRELRPFRYYQAAELKRF